jgi:NADH dehydrogenase
MAESTSQSSQGRSPHHVVIIGGGFAGLYAAKALGKASGLTVTLIDKRNFHLFQPLLYQVATGGLSPGDIASPLRAVLSHQRNTKVILGEVEDIDPQQQQVMLRDAASLSYDSLIVATGVSHHYFGKDWHQVAPGLKTLEDALEIRRRIFLAFEAAEMEPDPDRRQALLTFVVVGGGPTGVELAGALAELAFTTLKDNFRTIDPAQTRIILLEGMDRVLPPYPPELSLEAETSLKALGVEVQTNTLVTDIQGDRVTVKCDQSVQQLRAQTVLWAAGVKASVMGEILAKRTGVALDRVGRVVVEPDFSVANFPNLFVVGDLAHYAHPDGKPLPGVGAVAMQEGDYVARLLKDRLKNKSLKPFKYFDQGSLAVIGRNAAVANIWNFRLSGMVAWLIWVFVHIYYLVEFDNKLVVMVQWGWTYITNRGGSRIITGKDALKPIGGAISSPPNGLQPERSESPVQV